MDNKDFDKEEVVVSDVNIEATDNEASSVLNDVAAPDAEISEKTTKKAKKEKKPKKEKVAKSGSRKAIIICSIIAAVVVVIGVAVACVWFIIDRNKDKEEVPPEGGRTEEITGGDKEHTWLY